MQAARHDKHYAISGIAAHPCKKRKDGAPTFRYGKGRQSAEKGWASPQENLSMSLDQKAIIKQIDDILNKTANVADAEDLTRALSTILSAVHRLAPLGSVYAKSVQGYEAELTNGVIAISRTWGLARGILQALRDDYEAGYLQSVVELVHADIFADFLDMADYLLQQGYKDPAAVVTGSVLEAHLRKLCDKHGIAVLKPDGTPKKADALNSELAAAAVYSKLDQKGVTAWLDLRNKAAHGQYTEYTKEQVVLMLQAVQDFSARHPA
jgi:hypothetical protein